MYLAEDRSIDSIERSRLAHCIKIYGWLIDGTYIGEFISARDAEKELNLVATSIGKCLKGKNSRAGKYWFSYENNFKIKPKSLDSLIPKPKKLTKTHREYYIYDNINDIKISDLINISKYLNLPFGSLRHYVKNKILHPELLLHQKEYKNKFHLFLLNNSHIKFMIKDIV